MFGIILYVSAINPIYYLYHETKTISFSSSAKIQKTVPKFQEIQGSQFCAYQKKT